MIRALPLALLLAACSLGPPGAVGRDDGFLELRDGASVVARRPRAAGVSWTPSGSAVYLDDLWWALDRDPIITTPTADLPPFPYGRVIAASAGDLDEDGTLEIVVSYRHPARTVPWDPRPLPVDSRGASAHLGVVEADGTPLWLARRIPHPIGAIAACGEHVALAYTGYETDAVVATTAATWHGFGFTVAPELAGEGQIGCADVDADGTLDPVVRR